MINILQPITSIGYEEKEEKISATTWIAFLCLTFVLTFSLINPLKAQISQSPFAYTTETYTAFFDGNILGDDTNDDVSFTDIPIGFDFDFNGSTYREVSISPNGYISLENVSSTTSAPIADLNNVISGFGTDLMGDVDTTTAASPYNSTLQYKTIGLPPERIFVVQWFNYQSAEGGKNDDFNFQIKLYESSNRIAFHYGTCNHWFAPDVPVQVGLRGTGNDVATRTAYDTYDWKNTTDGNSKDDVLYVVTHINVKSGPTSGMKYTFSAPMGAQPIQLYSFSGAFDGNSVRLKWTTSKEINNDYFEVERSLDGLEFEVITWVKGVGNSNNLAAYQFVDRNTPKRKYFYRLSQIDFNGASETFKIIEVENKAFRENASVTVFPNPTTRDNISVVFNSKDKESGISILLYSIEGKVLFAKSYSADDISSEMLLDPIPGLAPKTYYLKVVQGSTSFIKPVIIIP